MIPNCICAATIMTFLYKNCNCNFLKLYITQNQIKYTLKCDNFKFSRAPGGACPLVYPLGVQL